MSDLRNKVAVITAGASGIGKAISEVFAASGASVRVLDSDIDRAESVAKGIQAQCRLATAHQCDISSLSSVFGVFEELCRNRGIDILVNNAGISHVGNLEQTTGHDVERIFQVNVKGAYHCLHSCIAHMKARRSGVILNIASIAGRSAGLIALHIR
jgi:2-keto-3-deoxy-L-fuconate dehydrogenase